MSAGIDIANITNMLRSAREQAGLTQADISRRVGCAERSIAGYELAERTPTLETLAIWAGALGYRVRIERA